MANTINWGDIYSKSWWGTLSTTDYFGQVYEIEYLTSDLNRRSDTYENNTMTIQLLENLEDC